MTWLVFVLSAFAVYRVADILAEESGPFAVFKKLRRKVPAKSNAGEGVRCSFCVGVWLSALVTLGLWHLGHVPLALTPLYCFAVSGAAAALKRALG